MEGQFHRLELLFGAEALEKLSRSRVAVFGVGGVGGYAVEVLARSGVGAIDIFDNDEVCLSNLNRQIIATHNCIGRAKVEVARERILSINPRCEVGAYKMFYVKANADEVDLSPYDFVVDCIDTVSAKMELVRRCKRLGVPIVCSMGAARKLNPSAFRVLDIAETRNDPLARVMRKQLRREGILHFDCVCSDELAESPAPESAEVLGSNAWVPAAAGIVIGGHVVQQLIKR